jgi:hypothetical protein
MPKNYSAPIFFFWVKDQQMMTLFQNFDKICFFSQKEFAKLHPLRSGVGISLSISSNLNDIVQIRVFYGKYRQNSPFKRPDHLSKGNKG